MAMDIVVRVVERSGDTAFTREYDYTRRSYDKYYQGNPTLTASQNETLSPGFDTVSLVYVEVISGAPIRVIANGDDYWEVSQIFLAHDVEYSQIALWSVNAAVARVYLGGS